jgi:3-oxoadipate enol-lactonase
MANWLFPPALLLHVYFVLQGGIKEGNGPHPREVIFFMFKTMIRGIALHYDRLGSGEPLLFIHGLGERKEGWQFQHSLGEQFDLIIPDLRGHGKSVSSENISIESFAKDVIALMDHLEIESAHICGLSMGGLVSQEIYRQAPERCRSLMLVSTFHHAPKSVSDYVVTVRKWRAEHLTKEQRIRLAAKTCLYSWNENILERFSSLYSPNQASYLKSMEACLEVDYRQLLPKVKLPVLVIGGQYDMVTPVWVQIQMHNLIPASELIIFRDAGHVTKLEKPKEFNLALCNFIKQQQLRAIS